MKFLKGKCDIRCRALACLKAALISLRNQQMNVSVRLYFSKNGLFQMAPHIYKTYLVEFLFRAISNAERYLLFEFGILIEDLFTETIRANALMRIS